MGQAIAKTSTAIVPFAREPQPIPGILVTGHSRRAPTLRARSPKVDTKLLALHALTAGFRAAKAEIDQARLEARAEQRQESRTKTIAFCLYYLMAGVMVFVMYAGITG